MIGILLLISILIIITILFLFSDFSNFKKVSNFNDIRTIPIIEEQKIRNEEFLEAYDNLTKKQKEQEKNEVPLTWNPNNTLQSMQLEPCLSNIDGSSGPGRLTCFSAPPWWYPEDKYNKDNFRVTYYGDKYNPIYNYLGNAQEMYWDFKSVNDTFSVI
jgi:hypothetical protein